MGCEFSSEQLNGPQGGDGLGAYYFNPTGPAAADNFGITASFTEIICSNAVSYTEADTLSIPSVQGACSEAGTVQAYLVEADGNVITCNTLVLTETASLLCPVPKTAIPTGMATISFDQAPDPDITTSIFIPDPVTFDITTPSTITTTTCTPAPTKCNGNNCYNAVHATPKIGSAFCSSYFTTAPVASTPTNIAKACSASEAKLSSACYCLVAPTCNQDNCLLAFSHTSSSASAFCASYTAGAAVASTPAFVTSKCGTVASRISSACTCLATPGPKFRRDDLFGRAANVWAEGVEEIEGIVERGVESAKEGRERGVTEVDVLVKRVVGYSGPDGTVTPGVAAFTETSTTLGIPTCGLTFTVK